MLAASSVTSDECSSVQLPELIEPFVQRLDGLGIPYVVTGSTPGILYGEPRMTHDIDIVIAVTEAIDREALESFIAARGLAAEWAAVQAPG